MGGKATDRPRTEKGLVESSGTRRMRPTLRGRLKRGPQRFTAVQFRTSDPSAGDRERSRTALNTAAWPPPWHHAEAARSALAVTCCGPSGLVMIGGQPRDAGNHATDSPRGRGSGSFAAVRMGRPGGSFYVGGLARTTVDGHSWHTMWHMDHAFWRSSGGRRRQARTHLPDSARRGFRAPAEACLAELIPFGLSGRGELG